MRGEAGQHEAPDGGRTNGSYQDLIAWQKAFAVTVEVYSLTAGFPPEEKFGLVSQMRRAAVGVASNIAEGWGRGATTDFVRFLRMARGSGYELETQAHVARAVGLIDNGHTVFERIDEMTRVINGLLRSVEKRLD